MVGILDYGVGNLFSLQSSLAYIGEKAIVTKDQTQLAACDHILLPGVGAFGDAAKKLKESGMQEIVLQEVAAGKPLLGICLGMQLLFDKSYEYGEYDGLGLIPGVVRPIAPMIGTGLKVPHIGWNGLHFPKEKERCPLFADLKENDCVYFVHSFAAVECEDSITATVEYGAELTAAVAKNNVYGTQFHPEKSGEIGLKILKAFCKL